MTDKQPTKAERRQLLREWRGHVRRTPSGMVPCIINGAVLAYRSAMGTDFNRDGMRRYFEACSPPKYWPTWYREADSI